MIVAISEKSASPAADPPAFLIQGVGCLPSHVGIEALGRRRTSSIADRGGDF